MNTRMAKRRTTPMPTIVHTMLVRVGSTVCCGKVGSASAGAVTSGSGGTEASGEGCSGMPASGRSALMVVPPRPVRDDRYRLNQPTPPVRLQALTQGARTLAGRHSVGSRRWQDTYGFGHAVPPCVATSRLRLPPGQHGVGLHPATLASQHTPTATI